MRSIDPRVKLLGVLFCIVSTSLIPLQKGCWAALFSLAFFVLASLSGFGALRALWRASVVLPFVLLPLLLRGGLEWQEALHHAAMLGVKAWVSALLLVVLVATTPLVELCAAAERLWVPRAMTQTILLTERYLRLLQQRFSAMMLSARLRGFVLGRRKEPIIGAMAGSLLLRTMEQSERVYLAMKARGYDGSFPQLTAMKLRPRDLVAALLFLLWGIGLWWVARLS